MTFIDITCMSDRSEEVIIETFPRRNDTPFFTTRSCRLVISFFLTQFSHCDVDLYGVLLCRTQKQCDCLRQ